jgi:hypothetical protein
MNGALKNDYNYSTLSNYVQDIIKQEDYEIRTLPNNDVVVIIPDNNSEKIAISTINGQLYYVDDTTGDMVFEKCEAGKRKMNKRSYISFPIPGNEKFMLANYIGMIAVGTVLDDFWASFKSNNWHDSFKVMDKKELNHADGDQTNNTYDNFDVTTPALNKAHSRLMAEIHNAFPNVYTEEFVDVKGNRQHKFINGNKVFGADIEKFNRSHLNCKIQAFKNVNGQWKSNYTKAQVQVMINALGIK